MEVACVRVRLRCAPFSGTRTSNEITKFPRVSNRVWKSRGVGDGGSSCSSSEQGSRSRYDIILLSSSQFVLAHHYSSPLTRAATRDKPTSEASRISSKFCLLTNKLLWLAAAHCISKSQWNTHVGDLSKIVRGKTSWVCLVLQKKGWNHGIWEREKKSMPI